MGKTFTPAYRIRITFTSENGGTQTSCGGWQVRKIHGRGNGRPTVKNLERYVQEFEASTQPGQCNQHIGRCIVFGATIERNEPYGHNVVASYRGPSFVTFDEVPA